MKPILFNTDMVRAILEGRKTVTRRVAKPQPRAIYHNGKIYDDDELYVVAENQNGKFEQVVLPYRPSDILYVRETWAAWSPTYGTAPKIIYKADGYSQSQKMRWLPSIHMPREAARIFLRVTDVRVERLQEMTIEDSLREGVKLSIKGCIAGESPLTPFALVWDSTIKKADRPLCGWEANPWVWVITFERISKEEAG